MQNHGKGPTIRVYCMQSYLEFLPEIVFKVWTHDLLITWQQFTSYSKAPFPHQELGRWDNLVFLAHVGIWTLTFKICILLTFESRVYEKQLLYPMKVEVRCAHCFLPILGILLLHSLYWPLSYIWYTPDLIHLLGHCKYPFEMGKLRLVAIGTGNPYHLNWVWLPFKSNVSPISNMEHGTI